MANIPLKTLKFPGLDDTYTVPQIDATLAVSGKAADAKATGDAIAATAATIPQLDDTLTVSGKAADAKATGDEISAIKAELTDTDTTLLSVFPQVAVESTAIASFPDGADGVPVKALTVEIEPVQDLHGYDNPWPAGGGKNKCYDAESHLFPRGDGLAIIENADTFTAYAKVSKNTDCVFSCATSPYRTIVYGFESVPAVGVTCHQLAYTTLTSTSYKFNSGAYEYVGFYYGATGHENTNVMIEEGSSATSYAPYSNICPITGWPEAKVTRTGVNVWDEETVAGYYHGSTGEFVPQANTMGSKNPIPVKQNTTYYLKSGTYNINVDCYDADMNFISQLYHKQNATFTTPSNCCYIHISNDYNSGVTYNHDISINYPSTDHDYHSGANNESYTIDLSGTRYGGTLDVTTGVLTVDRAKIVLDGTQSVGISNWRPYDDSSAWLYAPGITPGRKNTTGEIGAICDCLPEIAYGISDAHDGEGYIFDDFIGISSVGSDAYGLAVRVPVSGLTSNELINAYLAENPITIVYPLATPQTYQLDPTEVTTLLGDNNLWADTGNVELTYRADIKKYIDRLVNA